MSFSAPVTEPAFLCPSNASLTEIDQVPTFEDSVSKSTSSPMAFTRSGCDMLHVSRVLDNLNGDLESRSLEFFGFRSCARWFRFLTRSRFLRRALHNDG